jgi:thiol:disulfide interchange protein DsbC
MKHLKTIILSAAILLSGALFANEAELKTKIESLPMIKTIGASVINVIVQNDIYHFSAEVKGDRPGRFEGFLTKDLKTMIVGKAYDTQTQAELILPMVIDAVKLKSVAAYKMGNGKNEYFVFTDPECPYCQRLEKQITALKSDVTVYTILFPLNFHKNAKSMCRYIFNQKDDAAKAKAMKEIANKNDSYSKATYSTMQINLLDDMIRKGLDEANKIGINGTPTILDARGMKANPLDIIK